MNILRFSVFILGVTMSMLAYGQNVVEPKHASTIVSYSNVIQWGLALLLVLALIAGLAYLLKKTGHYAATGKNQLSVVSGLSLGMRERLVLIRVGEKQLLLGVTPGRIDKLMELEGESRLYLDQSGEISNSGLFAQTLGQLLNGKTNG